MAKIFNAIIVALFVFKCADSNVCISDNPCLCQISENSKIDLNHDSKDFLEDNDSKGNSFYFHGCSDGTKNFTLTNGNKTETKTLSGSLLWYNTSDAKVLGASKQIRFNVNEKIYEIIYKDGETVKASVQLICSNFDMSFIKIINANNTSPELALSSPHVCIITEKSGMSTGSVLLLIFFISFGVYLVGGCLILYFMRGARGLEMIPNIDFWRSLPGLVKDGIIFLFSGCNANSITTPETYDRI